MRSPTVEGARLRRQRAAQCRPFRLKRVRYWRAPRFRWSGSCEVWLLQFSEDPSFPAGATRTVVRTTDKQVEAEGSEGYWRVVGGNHGVSAGATSPPRQIGRWR